MIPCDFRVILDPKKRYIYIPFEFMFLTYLQRKTLVNTGYSSKYKSLQPMEHTGFEPVTSTLPVWRAPSCANAPALVDNTINPDENQVLFFQLFILFENREIRK